MGWRELSGNVFLLKGSPNTGLILDNRIAFVIDPGNGEGRAREIHSKVDETEALARFALLTHGHIDHFQQCKGFHRVFAHRYDISLIENTTVRNILEFNTLTTKGFRFITGDSVQVTDTLWWGDEVLHIQSIDTHGHTPGHTAYTYKGFVFAGDALFGDKLIDKVKIPYHTDVFEAMNALDVLEKLANDGKTIVPGHGPIVSGEEAITLVQKNREAIQQLISDLWQIMDTPGTLEEITVRLMEYYGLKTDLEFVLLDITPIRSILWHWHENGKVQARVKKRGIVWEKIR